MFPNVLDRRGMAFRSTAGALLLGSLGCAGLSPRLVHIEGSVTDTLDAPVARAHVRLTSLDHERTFASTESDASGHFAVSGKVGETESYVLVAQADGYKDWGFSFSHGPDGPEHIALERNVDRAALDALLALPEPDRQRRLIELLRGDYSSQIGVLFTFVGRLRPDLVALANAADAGIEAQQRDTARFLLALWGDPADAGLASDEALPVNDAPPGVTGAAPNETCEAYVVPHFTGQHVNPPYTLHLCGKPMIDPAGTRALVEFTVRYAHWAYWELLVMVRDDPGSDRWRLRSVVHWGIT